MAYFIILTGTFLLFLSSKVLKTDRVLLFLIGLYILWNTIWLVTSTFNPYNLYEVSDMVYFYQLIGVTMLTIGFLLPNRLPKRQNLYYAHNYISIKVTKHPFFVITFILFCIFGVYAVIKYRDIVLISAATARNIYFDEGAVIFGHRYIQYIWLWWGKFVFYLGLSGLSYNILTKRFMDKLSLLYLLFIFSYLSVGSGRGYYILLQALLICYIIINIKDRALKSPILLKLNSVKDIIKKTALYLSIVIAVFIFIGYADSIRRGRVDLNIENIKDGSYHFAEQAVIYQVGAYRAFDYGLSANYIERIGPLYGLGTMAGIVDMVYSFFVMFGLNDLFTPTNSKIASILQYEPIFIGSEVSFNFGYTHLMIFYLDFKVIGIVIIPLFYGFFYRKAMNHFMFNPNLFSLNLIMVLSLSLLSSIFSYSLQSLGSIVTVAGSLFFSKVYGYSDPTKLAELVNKNETHHHNNLV